MPWMIDPEADLGIVYIVDDDAAVARTIARAAASAGFETRIFGTTADFLACLDELKPGSVCLDIKMPGMSGIELLKLVSKRRPDLSIVMLTGHAEVGSTVEAFRSGAIHFLQKPVKREELIDALRETSRIVRQRQNQAIDPSQLQAFQRLTQRERQILNAIAQGLQSKEIAWKLEISIRTVDVHRANILAKLGARTTAQAVAIGRAATSNRRG
jgi:two-component system, LuxR family, response regulator FixJ